MADAVLHYMICASFWQCKVVLGKDRNRIGLLCCKMGLKRFTCVVFTKDVSKLEVEPGEESAQICIAFQSVSQLLVKISRLGYLQTNRCHPQSFKRTIMAACGR